MICDMGGKQDYFQAKCDSEFKKDLQARYKEEGYNSMSEYARALLDAALGRLHPEINEQMRKFLAKHRHATRAQIIEAALLYYLPVALRSELYNTLLPIEPYNDVEARNKSPSNI